MKRLIVALLSVALFSGMVFAQGKGSATTSAKDTKPSGENNADDLKKIENDWVAAQKAKDATKLGDILAERWVGVGPDGKTMDKATALASLKAPGSSLTDIQMGPMTVRVFGNAAVVIGSDTAKSMTNGKDSSGKYVFTDMFIKRDGKWRVISSQSTKVP